ncbi:MAG: FAD-binding oxidoreductase [Alphaproteobacteria bacterium]|nr:FAD-binding oxidoreductase [Alphaproteobacteria bacterium]
MDILTINDPTGKLPDTYYTATANSDLTYPLARGDLRCDVCVIGGGFTGLSSALHLAEKGYDVILLEAHRAGWGASGRNGGQMAVGQRLEQDELEAMVGLDHARKLWDLSLDSVDLVHKLMKTHDISCDFRPGILHADHKARFVRQSHAHVEKMRRDYGYAQLSPVSREEMREMIGTDAYFGGALDRGSGHIHPLNFALGLAAAATKAGVRIFDQSRVTAINHTTPAKVTTDQAVISADFVVMGCNGYGGRLEGKVAAKVMPVNNYILATEPLSDDLAHELIRDNVAVADSKFVINYYRLSADNRMLFGGTESYRYRFPADIAAAVRKPMLEIYPQLKDARIDFAWGGTLGVTMNRMPHFERLSGNILSAGGFSGHGVTLATLAGRIMADAIDGQAGDFDVMANVPTQRFPGGVALRWPLLVLAMTWFSLRDRF